MTIGIYCLQFNGTDKVYIGQSKNIEHRFKEHVYKLTKGTASKELQKAKELYGLPISMEILEVCSEDKLDQLEEYYIQEFDSFTNGFNSCIRGTGGSKVFGIKHGKSKYTVDQLYQVLSLLSSSTLYSFKNIEALTGVGYNTISAIKRGAAHTWLKDKFPYEYSNKNRHSLYSLKTNKVFING